MKKIITLLWIVALIGTVSAFNWDFQGSSAYTCPIDEWNHDVGSCGTNDTADGCTANAYIIDNSSYGDSIDGNYIQVGDRDHSCDYSRPRVSSDYFSLPDDSAYMVYNYKGCWGKANSYESDVKLYFQNGSILSQCAKTQETLGGFGYFSSNNWHFVNCTIPSGFDGETVYFRAHKQPVDCGNTPTGHTIEAFIFDNLSIQLTSGDLFDESDPPEITSINLTVTNYFNGSVRSDWDPYTNPDFLEYRLWASDLADCLPNSTDLDCSRELIHDSFNPNSIYYIESSASIVGGVIGYYLEVFNSTGFTVAVSDIVNITQANCYNDGHCGLNEICVAYSCIGSYTEYSINGTIRDPDGVALAGASVLYVANSFEYNHTFTTDENGYYDGNLPTCPDYEVFISLDGFGTTYEYYYEHWYGYENNYTLYPYNVNFTVTDSYNSNLSNANIVLTDVNNASHWFSGISNGSGNYQFLIDEGFNYSYTVSKTGYFDGLGSLGVWDYGYQTDAIGNHLNRLQVLYASNIVPNQTFYIRDHLTLDPIEGAVIRVNALGSTTVISTLTTDSNGLASVTLPQGWYVYEVSKADYNTGEWTHNLLSNNTLNAVLIRETTSLDQYNVTITTLRNGVANSTIFRIDCSPIGGEDYYDIVASNSSGIYIQTISEQSICTYRKFVDMGDSQSDLLFYDQRLITGNLDLNLSFNEVGYQPWYIYVGSLLGSGERILGSTVTITNRDTDQIIIQYQDNDVNPRSFYWNTGLNLSIVANKTGFIADPYTNPDEFIVNNSNGLLTRTRALGLIRSGADCNAEIYFQSDRVLGSLSDDHMILIQYQLTYAENGSNYLSKEIQNVNDVVLNIPNSVSGSVNILCGSSYIVNSQGWSKINGTIRKVYIGDPITVDGTELYSSRTQILRYGLSSDTGGSIIETKLGDSIAQPVSQKSNIFSQILGEFLEAFGYGDMSFIELLFWIAFMTIFIVLISGSYMVIKWSAKGK